MVINTRLTRASGKAETQSGLAMVEEIPGFKRVVLGGDKGYYQKEFVRELRDHRVTPHKRYRMVDPGSAERAGRKSVRDLGGISQRRAAEKSTRS